MLLVFGTILQHIRLNTVKDALAESTIFTNHYRVSVGGRGALQAVAAARAGAKTHIIGKTGDDELSKHILLRLRTHGVITSGVAKIENLQTGTSIDIRNENRVILGLGASEHTEAEQIPDSSLGEETVLLLQTELPPEENSKLLERAAEHGAKVILNASPRLNFSQNDLNAAHFLILDQKYKDDLRKLKTHENLTIVLLKQAGCTLHLPEGKELEINIPQLDGIEWIDREGTEDAFCGTFAASLTAKMPVTDAVYMGLMAAVLTASKPGGYSALPYLGDIHNALKGTKD